MSKSILSDKIYDVLDGAIEYLAIYGTLYEIKYPDRTAAISATELADLLCVTPRTLNNWEKDDPHFPKPTYQNRLHPGEGPRGTRSKIRVYPLDAVYWWLHAIRAALLEAHGITDETLIGSVDTSGQYQRLEQTRAENGVTMDGEKKPLTTESMQDLKDSMEKILATHMEKLSLK